MAGQLIVRIHHRAGLEGEAATTNALRETRLQPLEFANALLDPGRPGGGESIPVVFPGYAIVWKFGKLRPDLFQGEANPLGEDDESDPARGGPWEAPVTGVVPLGGDQAPLFVKPKG